MQATGNHQEKPALLLLHGFFGSPDNWRVCEKILSARWRVVLPKLPLFGVEHRADRLDHVVQFLAGLLAAEEISRVVVIGNSLGGQLAVNLALREPERISGLVLTGSSGLYENTRLHSTLNRRPDRDWLRERIGDIFFDPAMVTEQMIDELIELAKERSKVKDVLLLARSIRQASVRDLLPRLKCPALLVWGEDDRITPPAVAWEFQSLLPQSELHFLPCCGHAAMMEHPEKFSALAENFLERLTT